MEVLHGVSLSIRKGQILSIVGANGAGKSTLLNTISGFIPVRAGDVRFQGRSIVGHAPSVIARDGLRHVPEGRRVFAELSVEENLLLGGYGQPKAKVTRRIEHIYELFPRLVERRSQAAGTMSGGEQQMLAIGRALAADPKVLMLDEPSMGLAPLVVAEIFPASSVACATKQGSASCWWNTTQSGAAHRRSGLRPVAGESDNARLRR